MMKATATRTGTYKHTVRMGDHQFTSDEPSDKGGDDAGPCPQELLAASLATCTAVTMEMYAARKGLEVGGLEVACEYTPAERGCPTKFKLVLRIPDTVPEDVAERLRVIATKCPVHRTLDGEVMFDERVERVTLATG